MAVSAPALGIVVGVKDLASKVLQRLGKATDALADDLDDAQKAGKAFADSLSGAQVRGLAKASAGVKSLGKQMFGLSGGFKGVDSSSQGLISTLGGVVEAIPFAGPLIAKLGGALFTIMTRVAEVRKEVAQLEIQFLGLGGMTGDLANNVLDLSNQFGRSQDEVMRLARTTGTVDKDFMKTTRAVLETGKALGLADEQAASLVLTADAFKMTQESFKSLAGEVIQFQREFMLPGLTEELPAIFDAVRRASVTLGMKFEEVVGPATKFVGNAAAILHKRLGMLPKQAAQAAMQFTQSFEEMGFNLQAVFAGVDETFDQRTESIMELFVRSGRGATEAFDAINKAAAGSGEGYKGIAAALDDVAKRGGMGIARLRVLLVKQFGPEAKTIFDNLSEAGQAAFGKDFANTLKKAKTPAEEFQETLTRVMTGTDELIKRLNTSVNNLVDTLGTQMPKSMEKLENIMKTGLDLLNTFEKDGIAKVANEMDTYLTPVLDAVSKQFAKFAETATGGIVDSFKDLVNSLKEIAATFKAFRSSFMGEALLGTAPMETKLTAKERGTQTALKSLPSLEELPPLMRGRVESMAGRSPPKLSTADVMAGLKPAWDPVEVLRSALESELSRMQKVQAMSEPEYKAYQSAAYAKGVPLGVLVEWRTAKIDLSGNLEAQGGRTATDAAKPVHATGGP